MHSFRHFLPLAALLCMLFVLAAGIPLYGQTPTNPCDDGDPNTYDYVDSTGRCHHVATICCDDGNDCTLDRYDPIKKACVHEPMPNCLSCTLDTDKDGKVDCEDPCPEDAKNECCPGLVSNGCTPQLKVQFVSCYEVIICSSKKIDNVVLDIGITGVDPSDINFQQFKGQKAHIVFKDKRIKGIWVRSGCIPSIPGCIECGQYFPNPISGCDQCKYDSDGDGVNDCEDECPWNKKKTKEGYCGCYTEDKDTDGDKTPDCADECPNDPKKTNPGECGCGVVDTDADKDGIIDCDDECPNDPNKTEPGCCGCGKPETDTDMDKVPDCADECPNDPNKTKAGLCGCGVADEDTDKDGIVDCNDPCPDNKNNDCADQCPDDPNKTSPGACGCGVPDTDTDGDGTPDCKDKCPEDPNKKYPGACGCGTPDTDSDMDGSPDCKDECPNNPNKIKPGLCGCDADDVDSDMDGIVDCKDDCPNDADNNCDSPCPDLTSEGCLPQVTATFDGCFKVTVCSAKDLSNVVLDLPPYGPGPEDIKYDGLSGYSAMYTSMSSILGVWIKSGCNQEDDPALECPGCGEYIPNPTQGCEQPLDNCPDDPNKTEPGACGCGVADTDSDNDGTPNCDDDCPMDPNKTSPGDCGCGVADTDTDNDGTPNCDDDCPMDPNKTSPGDCGCGVADTDTDMDGIPDCDDECPNDFDNNCNSPCPDLTSEGCVPQVTATFDGCGKVTVCSAKDLSNVVLDLAPYGPGPEDVKYDGLSGYSAMYTSMSPILGVWIKSGCNFEDDPGLECPGCGEYIPNPNQNCGEPEDNCPDDPNKTEPGVCGCGVADTDSDNDGTLDCDDDCPMDSNKTEPGACGCGVADTDSDNDGTPDCNDDCPMDSNKTEPGDCGCGVAEGTCPDPCDELESDGCAAGVFANFTSCTTVNICSSKDLSNVVLDIAPYGPSSSDIKFDNLSDPSAVFMSGGATILGVWIKSGCNFEDDPALQCPGCGEYVNNPLNCNGMLIAPELSIKNDQELLQNKPLLNLKPQATTPKQEGKLDPAVGLNQPAKAFKIFPNPGKFEFRIDLEAYSGKTATVMVFDLSGKLVKKQEFEVFGKGLIDLNMQNQSPGMYQVKILLKNSAPLLGTFIIQE